MAHRLTLGTTARLVRGAPMVFFQAQCSCGWAGPCQPFASEAFTDAKVHAAIHDAALPEAPTP